MDDATPDTEADLLEVVTQAIAEAAASRVVEPLHRAQARAALAAIEAAGFAILPRPARGVRRGLGSALARAESGSGPARAESDDDIRAARHWLHGVAEVLDRMPEG
ncbi:hypothetical protein [Falsiroseomonas sp. HW251]|uniref:hypothetical protein n=1 Tax=Falsiroseomonas sp. HW251 TaxID=3390998 RepID=UPI003D31C430